MKVLRWMIFALIASAVASSVQAQGVSVFSHSACMLGRNGAGVADPCRDGSATFYNPAAIATQSNAASLGVLALITSSKFTFFDTRNRFESDQGVEWPPAAYASMQFGDRWGAGIGLQVPYGLVTQWPLAFEGRYTGYDNSLQAIYIQPTVAGEIIPGKLSVGAGLDVVRSTVKIRRRVDLATTFIPGTTTPFTALGVPLGTDFADAQLDVDDWAATFNIGVRYMPGERWAVGARYLHSTHLNLTGDADFEQVATGILLPPGNPLGVPAG
ncbi:MAG: OmpP1/FadL family transporter, partial [Longimicrobiales bacterium]